MRSFVHLNVHSEYSIIDGLIRIEELIQHVIAENMPAVAVTDQGNLFSTVKFYREAEILGIKPIIGAQINILADPIQKIPGRLTLLCQNIEGYRNLTRLITKSFTEKGSHSIVHVRKIWLKEYNENLIALSGGREGEIGQALLSGNILQAETLIQEWGELFENKFYLELQRTGKAGEENYIKDAINLASKYSIPVVASNDVRFLKPGDYEAHEARVCIQQGYTLNDPRRPRQYSVEQYFKSANEMSSVFSDIPECIENTVIIAERCNLELTLGENYLPHFPVPDAFNQDDWLRKQAKNGLKNRIQYLQDFVNTDDYKNRLESELDVITKMGFSGYFLIVADFIKWAKDQLIPVGPGRGSGAGSLVAYALGITELDPFKYELLFERFLNPERVSLPDFDIDFCMDRRDEVIEYVAEKYGRDRVSQIITYGTMAARAVVRDVGRILGHPYGFVDQIAKLIPFELNMTLGKALSDEQTLKHRYENEEEVAMLIDLAMKLEGLVRNAGRHAGGIVIAPRPLNDYMPLYCEQGTDLTVTQFDMGDVESVGLVKFDFLGLRTLTIIDQTISYINDSQTDGKNLNIDNIPLDDNAAYDLIRRTETTAVFQLESDGMKKLIKRLQPDRFDDLIALVALFRPGPLQSGMVDDYIDRKHGKSRIHYLHPNLEKMLKPTYGIILYQEQVMQIAQILAGYTLGSADLLRRAMGKKKPEEMAEQREIFIRGALKNGVEEHNAAYIFDLMEKFAGYGFNKSHSAAYALIAYQTAWLKTHYPAAFMASVLSSDMDNTDKVVNLLDELSRMNLKLEPPHVNYSGYRFTVIDEKTIRYGLGAIKGIGKSVVDNIVSERSEKKHYKDMFDFCQRIDLKKINRRALEALIKSGAMDDLGPNRNSMTQSLGKAIQMAEQHHKNTASGQDDLFGLVENNKSTKENLTSFLDLQEWNDEERLTGERETLGFYLRGHPILRYESELSNLITYKLKDIKPGNVVVAGYIHRLRVRSGIKGRMAELLLDDRTSRVNVTVYSDKYQKFRNYLLKNQLVIINGDVISDDYFDVGYSIVAKEIYNIEQARNRYAAIHLKLPNHLSNSDYLENLRKLLVPYRSGVCKVGIIYKNNEAICKLELGDDWRVTANDKLLESLRKYLGNDNVQIEYNR